MNPDASRDLTEQDLALFGRWLARAYLEVERGQRSALTLERFLTPLAFRVLVHTPPMRHTEPVRPEDVGGIAVTVTPGRAYATVGIAACGGTWEALLIELRPLHGRWTVVELGPLRWRCGSGGIQGNGEREALAS